MSSWWVAGSRWSTWHWCSAGSCGRERIHVRSRHGLLPAVHTRSGFAEFDDLDLTDVKDARTLLHRVRAAAEKRRDRVRTGATWCLRCDRRTPAVWAQLPLAERSRLLRHAQRHWEIRRHRMSPTVARSLDSMIGAGRLNVSPGRVERVVPIGEHGRGPFDVTMTSGDRRETLRVGALVDATGPSSAGYQLAPLADSRDERGRKRRSPGARCRSGRVRFARKIQRPRRSPHHDDRLEPARRTVRIDRDTRTPRPGGPHRLVPRVPEVGTAAVDAQHGSRTAARWSGSIMTISADPARLLTSAIQ